MKVDEVQRQLKEELFLLVGRLDDLCDLQMEMKLELQQMHTNASEEQMDAALACLARLDASNASNVADVAAAVAAQLGGQLDAHAGKYEQLVRAGLKTSREKMAAMEKALIEHADRHAAMHAEKADQIAGKLDQHETSLAEISEKLNQMSEKHDQSELARKKEREDLEVKSGVQNSAGSFEARFEYAPFTAEVHGVDAGDVAERAEVGEGSFATTYRMRAINGATPGVESGLLFAVKKVVFNYVVVDLVWDFSSAPCRIMSWCKQNVFKAHRKTVTHA